MGQNIADALVRAAQFPGDFTHLVSIGEQGKHRLVFTAQATAQLGQGVASRDILDDVFVAGKGGGRFRLRA